MMFSWRLRHRRHHHHHVRATLAGRKDALACDVIRIVCFKGEDETKDRSSIA